MYAYQYLDGRDSHCGVKSAINESASKLLGNEESAAAGPFHVEPRLAALQNIVVQLLMTGGCFDDDLCKLAPGL